MYKKKRIYNMYKIYFNGGNDYSLGFLAGDHMIYMILCIE